MRLISFVGYWQLIFFILIDVRIGALFWLSSVDKIEHFTSHLFVLEVGIRVFSLQRFLVENGLPILRLSYDMLTLQKFLVQLTVAIFDLFFSNVSLENWLIKFDFGC